MELRYVPNFKIRNVENYFRNFNMLYNEGEMEGETNIELILGGHHLHLLIPERISIQSFKFVINREELKGFKLVDLEDKGIIVRHDRIVSLEEIKMLIATLFGFLIGEGHRDYIMEVVYRHQDLMVGIFSCISEVYFLPDELVEYDNEFNKAVLDTKADNILDNLYSVVVR